MLSLSGFLLLQFLVLSGRVAGGKKQNKIVYEKFRLSQLETHKQHLWGPEISSSEQ